MRIPQSQNFTPVQAAYFLGDVGLYSMGKMTLQPTPDGMIRITVEEPNYGPDDFSARCYSLWAGKARWNHIK